MFVEKKKSNLKFSKISLDLIKSFKENVCEQKEKFLTTNSLGKNFYNLTFNNGKLTENSGLQELVLPTEQAHSEIYEKKINYPSSLTFKKVWRYKYYSLLNSRYEYVLLVYASDNKIYFNNIFSYGMYLSSMGSFTFNEEPTLLSFRINGADCVGFATSTNDFVVWNCDSSPYAVSTAPKFRSICLHNEKMFAIENGANYAVRYSSTLDPTQWTGNDDANGGRIDLSDFRGELRKIVSHLDNLYVFRDFGISKIYSYSSVSQPSSSNVYNSSTKIYTNTICVCGEDICFLCEDGLYKFDGYKVIKIDLSIFENFKNYLQVDAQTCFYNNKLYISCFLNFSSSHPNSISNNSIIVVDLQNNSFSIIYNVPVCSFYCFKDLNASKLIVCLNGLTYGNKLWELCSGETSEITLDKLWKSNEFVVTSEREIKNLKRILIQTKSNLTLTLSCDKLTKTISVPSANNLQTIYVNLRGRIFGVELTSQAKKVEVDYFKLDFAV